MIRKVYAKIFILFFISLLASNENLSSIKYPVCLDKDQDGDEKKFLFTKVSHNTACILCEPKTKSASLLKLALCLKTKLPLSYF